MISIINGFSIRNAEIDRMNEQYVHFKESHLKMIIKDLWLTDYDDLQQQIDFIQMLEYVDYIELKTDEDDIFVSGKQSPDASLVYSGPLEYEYNDSLVEIGQIYIYFDHAKIDSHVRSSIVNLFLMILASSLVLSVITGLIFNRIVGRHIKALSVFLCRKQDVMLGNRFAIKRRNGLEDELTELSDSINLMRDNINDYIRNEKELKTEMQREAEFREMIISIMSHDLRGPLSSYNSLTGRLVETLGEEPLENSMEILQELHKSSESLWLLTENLLDWAKSHEFNSPVSHESFSVSAAVDESINLCSTMRYYKNIDVVNRVDDTFNVDADQKMLETVLRNLICNAVKFTKPGGRVEISAEKIEENIVLSVEDDGVGMSPDAVRAFYAEGVLKGTRGTQNEKGFGLGLTLCRRLTRINNGKMDIVSSPGNGTRVDITLPAVP